MKNIWKMKWAVILTAIYGMQCSAYIYEDSFGNYGYPINGLMHRKTKKSMKKCLWKNLFLIVAALQATQGLAWVYEDDFKGSDMTLNFRATSQENTRWIADPQLMVIGKGGVVKASEVGVYYAALPLSGLTEKSVVRLDLTLRLWRAPGENDTGFAFGFTPKFPSRPYSEGSAMVIVQSMSGKIQVVSGKGLTGRLTDGWENPWEDFAEDKPFTLHYAYSIQKGTLSLTVEQDGYQKTLFDEQKVNWIAPGVSVPLGEINYLLFMFNKQSVTGASGYIKNLRLEVTE